MTTREQLANQVKQKLLQPQSDESIIKQLQAMGFSDEYEPPQHRLICAVEGREFVGKTHFSLTAPEPIIFFNVDLGTEGVVHKFQDAGKRIFIKNIRVPKETTKDSYALLWAETKQAIRKAYSLTSGTVVWDTETEINELARLAHFGKLTQVMPHNYAEVNRDLRDVIDWAYDAKSMSSIFIRKVKPKYINNVRTGEYEGAGWGDMEYKCQVNLTMYRESSDNGPEFCAVVKKCRANDKIVDTVLRGPMCNFGMLLELVHG